jgi:hypothetical protein
LLRAAAAGDREGAEDAASAAHEEQLPAAACGREAWVKRAFVLPIRQVSPDARTPVLTTALSMVRLDEERRRELQAEGLGGLGVDDQLELHRLLDG